MNMAMMSTEKCQGQIRQQTSNSASRKTNIQVKDNPEFSNKLKDEESIKDLERAAQPYLGGNIDLKG